MKTPPLASSMHHDLGPFLQLGFLACSCASKAFHKCLAMAQRSSLVDERFNEFVDEQLGIDISCIVVVSLLE